MRRIRSRAALGGLLVPVALATVSLAPALLIFPRIDLVAYRALGYESHTRDFWAVPARYEASAHLARFDAERISVSPDAPIRLIGAGFAGDGWTIEYEYIVPTPGLMLRATLSFVGDAADDSVGSGLTGLKLMSGLDSTGAPTQAGVMAVGVNPPFNQVAFHPARRHRLSVSYDGSEATVLVDRRTAWTGDPGWPGGRGVYPVIDLGPGLQLITVVPRVDVEFRFREPPASETFAEAFRASAVDRQTPEGRFAPDNATDAWTALALIFQHRRTGNDEVGAALDRWADGRRAAAQPGRAWPGTGGPASIGVNVGAPALALALWARDRGRDDWLTTVADVVDAAGFTPCAAAVPDWCRLGNLQPDGRVARAEDPDAARSIAAFQVAETAAFIAGVHLEDRRAWTRSLAERTFVNQPCQSVAVIGPDRTPVDERPWALDARRTNGLTLLLLGLAYQAQPQDPVWSEARLVDSLRCRVELLRTQVLGPVGWRDPGGLPSDVMLGGAEEAAARLLAPLTGVELDDRRFREVWRRLIDPATNQVGTDPTASSADRAEATARVAMLVALLDG